MSEDKTPSFWTSLPGILTGAAGFVTAITGLYLAVSGQTAEPPQPEPEPTRIEQTTTETPVASAQTDSALFPLHAVIDDPDGYTNVRSQASANSQIVAIVRSDEPFFTYRQPGNWWQIQTRDGKIGYMHVSRIRLQTP